MQLKHCSRTEAEQYIRDGWVQVNGKVAEDPAFRVLQQTVHIDPQASLLNVESISLLLNKPPDYLDATDPNDTPNTRPNNAPNNTPNTRRKPGQKNLPHARSLLTSSQHNSQDTSGIRHLQRHFQQLTACVPLETGASGLLVFTQDWRIQRKLSEDLHSMEHEMVADVVGDVSPQALQTIARLLKDPRNPLPATKCSVNSNSPERSKLRFAIKGAHPGLVAYLCERAELQLLALRRIRLGRVALSDLPLGQWRYLAGYEKF
jgi:23S rRNA pseudouridine2604 synthase